MTGSGCRLLWSSGRTCERGSHGVRQGAFRRAELREEGFQPQRDAEKRRPAGLAKEFALGLVKPALWKRCPAGKRLPSSSLNAVVQLIQAVKEEKNCPNNSHPQADLDSQTLVLHEAQVRHSICAHDRIGYGDGMAEPEDHATHQSAAQYHEQESTRTPRLPHPTTGSREITDNAIGTTRRDDRTTRITGARNGVISIHVIISGFAGIFCANRRGFRPSQIKPPARKVPHIAFATLGTQFRGVYSTEKPVLDYR